MTTIGIPPRTPQDWDVPAEQITAQVASDVYRKAMATTHSPSDRIAYALDVFLVAHPKAPVSKDPDYPGFAEWVAQEEAKNEAARRNR
jgi:hypothetical protein